MIWCLPLGAATPKLRFSAEPLRIDMHANRWLVLSVPLRGLGALRKAPCGVAPLFKPESPMAVEFEPLIRASSLIW
jgi:hypothetical protein